MKIQNEEKRDFVQFSDVELYYDLNKPIFVPSKYILMRNRVSSCAKDLEEDILTNQDIIKYIEESGSFDFLKNSEEDIYNPDDGKPIC